MKRLHQHVAATVRTRGLWEPGERVAVAVSGGRDSAVLLHLLLATRGLHGGELWVVTVDHGTRAGSAEDARWVAEHAAALGLPVHVVRLELGGEASEDACRRARYAAFAELDADHVAVAHHARDQAETVLLGLLDGGGTAARAGMAWRRGRIVRPLLDVELDAMTAWAEARGLTWREDPSNAQPRFLRNRVRHELLPLLEDLRPGAVRAIARGARHAAADEAWCAEHAAAAPWDAERSGWPRAWVASEAAPVVRRALRQRLPWATSAHLDALVAAARRGSGGVQGPRGVAVRVRGAHVVVEAQDVATSTSEVVAADGVST